MGKISFLAAGSPNLSICVKIRATARKRNPTIHQLSVVSHHFACGLAFRKKMRKKDSLSFIIASGTYNQ